MPYPNEHSARLQEPSKYENFHRENDKFGDGIHAIFGILSDGTSELQAIRFDAQKYSEAEARKWLEDHQFQPILFEPAASEANANVPSYLTLIAESSGLNIQAKVEEGKNLRRFSMVAYTGDAMTLSGWGYPVVVDLAGLVVGKKARPILLNHDTTLIVGHTDMVATDGKVLNVTGIISGIGAAAQEVIGASDNGFPWQASIGAVVKKVVFIPEGKTVQVNGREFSGPIYVVRQAKLGEVSFVALGADDATMAKVEAGRVPVLKEGDAEMETEGKKEKVDVEFVQAASENEPLKNKGETMNNDEITKAITAERERVAAIQEICGGEFSDIEHEAIKAGWSIEQTSRKILAAIRESRPKASVNIITRKESNLTAHTLEAALCLRANIPEETLLKQYGEQTLDAANPYREISLQGLITECAHIEGQMVPRTFGNDTIRAGFSTVSLPGILSSVANKKLLTAFQAQQIAALKLCSEGELNDFKESERYRLTDVGDLEQVAPDGELKHGGLKEEKATNQIQTYGKIFTLTREMIYNDDLGAFLRVPEGMGARAARKIDQLFFSRLLSNPVQPDGIALFHANHKNLQTGVDTALSGDALAQAVQQFLEQTDADGQPININPKFLLVPPALKITARELLSSTFFIATGTSTSSKARIPTYNAFADEDIEVVASPYLSNSSYSGHSSKAWYLFADPAVVDTFEIGYLRGRKVPTVEKGETDFDTLGIKFRVYFDIGVREQDYRGMVKFAGE